jgi:hypothetical protein
LQQISKTPTAINNIAVFAMPTVNFLQNTQYDYKCFLEAPSFLG